MTDELELIRSKKKQKLIGKMKKVEIKIFEPAMCCPGGGCGSGPNETSKLSKTLEIIGKKYGQNISIARGSMNQNSSLFFDDEEVLTLINEEGMQLLPITKINGNIAFKGVYPTYQMLNMEIKKILDNTE